MNERIRELVRQAGGHFSTRNLMSNPVQQRESIELWDDKIEKFAELIVEEFAELMEKQHSWITNVAASKLIRTHFGVEEWKLKR